MQQPQRYIPSVSDLYGTDEIELLLDEIRELELEPVCCQLEDEQDFEIAGSRAGELSLSLESPLGTCSSWDSHANYKQHQHTPLPWGVALHCDPQHLKTPTGIVRILLVVSLPLPLPHCIILGYFPHIFIYLIPVILGRLSGLRMLRGHSPGWPLSTATHRTPEADGLLCALLATHHMPHDLSRYIAYSAHVSIQLDESGKEHAYEIT